MYGNKFATGQILRKPVEVVKGRISAGWAQKSPEPCTGSAIYFTSQSKVQKNSPRCSGQVFVWAHSLVSIGTFIATAAAAHRRAGKFMKAAAALMIEHFVSSITSLNPLPLWLRMIDQLHRQGHIQLLLITNLTYLSSSTLTHASSETNTWVVTNSQIRKPII